MPYIYIKRADGTGVSVSVSSDDNITNSLEESSQAQSIAAIEQANATWQIVALLQAGVVGVGGITSHLSRLATPGTLHGAELGVDAIEDLERRLNDLEDSTGKQLAQVRRHITGSEARVERKLDKITEHEIKLEEVNVWGARIADRLDKLEAHQASPDGQHAASSAQDVSTAGKPQNDRSEASEGYVEVATPNAPTDPEAQVNLLASMRMLLEEIDPYTPETYKYAESMVKVVELFFNTDRTAAE
jgi:hypothetical protein